MHLSKYFCLRGSVLTCNLSACYVHLFAQNQLLMQSHEDYVPETLSRLSFETKVRDTTH